MYRVHHQPAFLCAWLGPEEVVSSGCASASFWWMLGVVERYLLEKTEHLESLVLWLRYECVWYQTHNRAANDCQESIASCQPRTEIQERWGKLYAIWKVCVFLIHLPKSITPRHKHHETQESTFGHYIELLQRTFPLSPSSSYSLTCH